MFKDPDGVLVSSIVEATKHICDALEFSKKLTKLQNKPKNFVIDTWLDYQPLINGKTLVWYYCDVFEKVKTKVI